MSPADVVVILVIAVIVFFCVRSIYKKAKNGGGCGCGCPGCSGSCSGSCCSEENSDSSKK